MSEIQGPRFGTADLSNCEREQIQFAGSIQPHGALLVLDPDRFSVDFASANLFDHAGMQPLDSLGRPLKDLSPTTVEAIRSLPWEELSLLPHAVPFDADGRHRVGSTHLSPQGKLILEVEEAIREGLQREEIEAGIARLVNAPSMARLQEEATRLIRRITGYDRVMLYQFDEDGHGAVIAEEHRDGLESFLGNHYPASDIPQIARTLYIKNRLRTLVDVEYDPVPLLGGSAADPERLDMSLCHLRSMSPIHLQYLKNMGVSATLVVSLVIHDELWGLVACHHYSRKRPSHDVRAACALIGEVVSTRILALESAAQAAVEVSVRRLEQRMVESIGRTGEWLPALLSPGGTLLECVGASGVALVHSEGVHTLGMFPPPATCGRWHSGWKTEPGSRSSQPTSWLECRSSIGWPRWRRA